jgi:hypothetical protein
LARIGALDGRLIVTIAGGGIAGPPGAPLGPDAYIAHVDGLDGPTMVYPSG